MTLEKCMTTPIHNVSWERLPDMPVAKWEPASLVIDDKLYVLGGYEDNVVSSRRVDVFDPADGSWTQLQTAPAGFPTSTLSRTIPVSGSLAV